MKLPGHLVPIGFGVALASLLAAGVSSYAMTRRLIATSRLVTHTHEVLEQLTTLLSTMEDVETGGRGYVITGDQTFLEPYNRARIEAPRQLDALRQLTADNQNQQARVGRLELLIGQKGQQVNAYVSLRREQGFEGARRVIASGQGKRIMDDIRAAVAEMSAEEARLLRQRQAATDQVAAITALAIVIEGVLALGLLAAVFTALRRESRERSEAEQRVHAVNAGLEQRIREATAELRQSEARLRSTLDTMIEGCQVIGFDWRYLYLNPSASAHGRRSVEELTGRTMMECYPGIENTKVFEAIARCMRDRVPQKMENEFVFPDGSKGWFQLNIEPVPEGALILSADITERREAQRAVEDLARQNQLLLDSAGEGILGLDVDGNTTLVNPAAARMLGYTAAEMLGRLQHALIHHTRPDGTPYPREECRIYAAYRSGEVSRVDDEVFWRKDGTSFPVEYTSTPIRDGRGAILGAVVTFTDITERKQVQEALREKERRLAESQRIAHIGSWFFDMAGRITWSDEAYRIWGVSPDTFTPDAESFLSLIDPADRPAMQAWTAACLAGDKPEDLEFRRVLPDGTVRFLRGRGELFCDAEGKPAYTAGTIQDITERKRLEAQLRQAQKMEAMGRLAGGVAHDFNNLLSAMFVEVDLGLADVPADHPVAETLQQVRRAAEQAAGLSRQLLAFSRRQVVEPTVFELNELVSESERMLRRLIGEDVELITRLAPDIGALRADRGQIEQVLVNLVVNARDAMPEGGKLVIETANMVLDADYAQQYPEAAPGPHVVLTVSDTGTGMTKEVLSHIFEPFFTTKEHGKGTGLGLATSYGIVKRAGGHIAVYTEPGLGTTFRVYLPRIEAARRSSARRTPVVTLRGTETILLVEDSALLRGAAARILRTHGYHVLEAGDGHEAVQLLAGSPDPVHLLLSDVVLPGLTGREVAKRVREARPETRVLFVSGYTEDLITYQRLSEDGVAFLQKPYTQETLTRKVREVLDAPTEVSA